MARSSEQDGGRLPVITEEEFRKSVEQTRNVLSAIHIDEELARQAMQEERLRQQKQMELFCETYGEGAYSLTASFMAHLSSEAMKGSFDGDQDLVWRLVTLANQHAAQ